MDDARPDPPSPGSDLSVVAPAPSLSTRKTEEPHCEEPGDIEGQLIAYRKTVESRDELIRKARADGISEARIAKLSGHSRNTVRGILGAG
ncbi:DUF6003 family protein [Streptomyces sp. NPDC085460]|uniref:DUF6003 family protein n=1 Tax=Streptomyces sp. NPDC085460 TaxID=3365723 RepID=UPI0037D8AACE